MVLPVGFLRVANCVPSSTLEWYVVQDEMGLLGVCKFPSTATTVPSSSLSSPANSLSSSSLSREEGYQDLLSAAVRVCGLLLRSS